MVRDTFSKGHYRPFRARIDQRRIRLPRRLWTDYAAGGYITSDTDQSLLVFSQKSFEVLYSSGNRQSLKGPPMKLLRRMLFCTADRFALDKVGRFYIPSFLYSLAGLEDEAVCVYLGAYIGIWPPHAWEISLGNSEFDEKLSVKRAIKELLPLSLLLS